MALFNHKPLRDNAALKFSPDGSLNGDLKKKWINQKGVYYLVKSGRGNANEEVFNEILVSDISPFDDSDIVARPFCNKSTFGCWDQQRQFITEYSNLKKG